MHTDLFIFDTERFKDIASEDALKNGYKDFIEGKVIALSLQDNTLTAQVQDTDSGLHYMVELKQSTHRNLAMNCPCNYGKTACQHAIAALYCYVDYTARSKANLENAANRALQEFVLQAKNQIRVKLLSGHLGFGTWQATGHIPSQYATDTFQVTIRSLRQHMNTCTCPDIHRYRLGTCKHIEAVLDYIRKKPEYEQWQDFVPSQAFTYLTWQNNQPLIALSPAPQTKVELAGIVSHFFDSQNHFSGQVTSEFFRFVELATGREDLVIGEDTLAYAQQNVQDLANRARIEQITEDITRNNNLLQGVKAKLQPYQTEGAAFLAAHGKALLADDLGLGKTFQALTAAMCLIQQGQVQKVLVVCPSSLRYHWFREIKKITGHRGVLVQGDLVQRNLHYRQEGAIFFIINYELALRDLNLIRQTIVPDILVIDEPQRIKNWQLRLVPKLQQIKSPNVFVLTSIVIEKRLEDLYHLIQLVDGRQLNPFWRYLVDYTITDGKGNFLGYRYLNALYKRLSHCLLRRKTSQVKGQLLDKTEVWLDVPLDKKQRELHDQAIATATEFAQLAGRRALTPGELKRFMAALQKARMACNSAGLIDGETQGSPKLQELAYLLEELCIYGDYKVVVFSQWSAMLELVESLVVSLGLPCARIDGTTNNEDRQQQVKAFQHSPQAHVLACTDAGSFELSLHGVHALINMDMPWNPAVWEQRQARVYKPTKHSRIQVFSIVAEKSYEQQLNKLVKSNRELFDGIIGTESSYDTIQVNKKTLQVLMATLISPNSIEEVQVQEQQGQGESPDNIQLQQILAKIKLAFYHRIERILGTEKELLVVVNNLNVADTDTVQQLSKEAIPTAILDKNTLACLLRLEICQDLAELPVLYEPSIQEGVNPLISMAKAKLHSADILLSQGSDVGVLDLLASALLLQVAAIAGQFQPPAIENVAVWLFNEILPQQLLTHSQAETIMRVVALSQSQSVPPHLVGQALQDAKALVESIR